MKDTTTQQFAAETCTCDYIAPELWRFRLVRFNKDQARYWRERFSSPTDILEFVFTELYDHRAGTFFDLIENGLLVAKRTHNGEPLDFDLEDEHGDRLLDRVFKGDPCRTINRYLDYADGVKKNRLSKQIYLPTLMLFSTRKVHECRTKGHCACAAEGNTSQPIDRR